jgi:acyl-CoA thioesterase
MNDMTAKAREVFAADRYATELTDIEIASAGDHEASCTLTLAARHCNARGVAMGGALYTLADFAAAIAANSDCLGSGDLHWVSLDATAHYLSPAPLGARLAARSHALKHGRSTALYQTIIESLDNGKTVAIVETTMVYV